MATKLAGVGLVAGGIVTHYKPDLEETGIAMIVVGVAAFAGSNAIFGPLINEGRRKACYREKLASGETARTLPPKAEPVSFTLAPLVMPTPSGETAYGLSGGFRF